MQIVQAWELGRPGSPQNQPLEVWRFSPNLETIIFRFQPLNVWGCAGGSVSRSISIDMKYI